MRIYFCILAGIVQAAILSPFTFDLGITFTLSYLGKVVLGEGFLSPPPVRMQR